jgi:O-acetyl-ADP-ribose deacetylase (regulator of RNase III)
MTSLSPAQTVSVQQQQPKEQSQFFLSNDFYKSLIFFQLKPDDNTQSLKIDEQKIKEHFKSNQVIQNLIQSIYVLHENTSILIVAKDSSNDVDLDQLENLIKTQVKLDNLHLERKDLPFSFEKVSPLLLTTEINDSQLELISKDKYEAIKTIEAKTGLKLKKIKKSIYFSGLLFQFNILNEILAKNSKKLEIDTLTSTMTVSKISIETKKIEIPVSSSEVSPSEKPINDWTNLYAQSEARYNFKLKPKLVDLIKTPKSATYAAENSNLYNFEYDVFIFHADLTELNTDGLVNATNPNLHPGYDGDGIARRIREKGGKQMVDACKRILKEDRKNVVLSDSESVYTKSYGKLKAKYVIHTVAPTWSKYILNASNVNSGIGAESNLESKFEPLLEQSFTNIMKLAHDPKLKLNSIAFPVASNSLGKFLRNYFKAVCFKGVLFNNNFILNLYHS